MPFDNYQSMLEFCKTLLDSNSSTYEKLLSSIKIKVQMYGLSKTDEADVLQETCWRAINKYGDEPIEFPAALFYKIALNIVREMSRKHRKFVFDSNNFLENQTDSVRSNDFIESLNIHDVEKVKEVRKKLSQENRLLLELWMKDISWEDIEKQLAAHNIFLKIPAAKKRIQRIISRLKRMLS